jgi:DNA-binding transcriptional ArsR family regulator
MSWFSGRSNGKYAAMSTQKPLSRVEGLVVEALDDEVLVYDRVNARAHCLSGTAAAVWRACDGETGTEELAARLDLDPDTVSHALAELESNGLLEGLALSNGHTRREFSMGAVKAGAAIGAAPMIYSILAPTPAAAATPSTSQCLFYSAKSCSGCKFICGCCCCCEGCPTATTTAGAAGCKICLPTHMCSTANFTAGCANVPGVLTGGCSSGPNCSDTAIDGPVCDTSTVSFPPGPQDNCCYPPCVNGQPSTTNCGASGSASQPCNCTQEPSPCGT